MFNKYFFIIFLLVIFVLIGFSYDYESQAETQKNKETIMTDGRLIYEGYKYSIELLEDNESLILPKEINDMRNKFIDEFGYADKIKYERYTEKEIKIVRNIYWLSIENTAYSMYLHYEKDYEKAQNSLNIMRDYINELDSIFNK